MLSAALLACRCVSLGRSAGEVELAGNHTTAVDSRGGCVLASQIDDAGEGAFLVDVSEMRIIGGCPTTPRRLIVAEHRADFAAFGFIYQKGTSPASSIGSKERNRRRNQQQWCDFRPTLLHRRSDQGYTATCK